MLPEIEAYIKKRDLKMALIAEKESIKDAATRQELEAEGLSNKKMEAIRTKQIEEGHRIRDKATALIEPLEQGIKELEPEIQDIDQKIKFLKHREKIEGKKPEFDDESVKTYHDKELVKLGILYKDEFTIIKLFVAENDRPKNRWTLMALGYTLLRELYDMPHEYALPIHMIHGAFLQKALKHLPTLEEIKVYAGVRLENLMRADLVAYEGIKKAYLNTINNYTLEDFRVLLEPRKVSDQDAPIVFRITRYEDTQEYRLYQGFYYTEEVSRQEVEGNPFYYIEVDDLVYARYCRPERMRIMETGNTLFGDWWSVSVSNDSRGHSVFTRENWEKTVAEATNRIDELNSKRRKEVKQISFNPPEVEWVTPVPDEFFSTPNL